MLLFISEFAAQMGISVSTARRLCYARGVASVNFNRPLLAPTIDVQRLIEAHLDRPPAVASGPGEDKPATIMSMGNMAAPEESQPRRRTPAGPPHGPRPRGAEVPGACRGSPSSAAAAGRDGRVLVRCFADARPVDVLAAAGLSMSSLFSGPPRTSQQISATLAEREQRRAFDRAQRQEERSAVEWLRLHWLALEHDVPRLARRLALMEENAPGAPATTNHFHP